MGPLYGVLVYLYVTYLILPGPPFTADPGVAVETGGGTSGDQYVPLMTSDTAQYVGAGIGTGTGVGLTLLSLFSTRTRFQIFKYGHFTGYI